jgi:phosphoribosylformimino-5-aminoimidazole carboxamide ribotide isomerase
MDVVPGIDLLDGKCVCPVHMPFADSCPFSHDPAEVAVRWAEQGARRLYVADLDGARTGGPKNLDAVKRIMEAAGVPVDLGGGIRTVDTARRVLDIGVDRVVVGTTAALEEGLAREIFSAFAERTVLSVASLNGYVAVRDWQARTDERAEDFARRMVSLGARRVVFTDVSRKGMHGGVNVPAVRRMAQALNVPVIASGGVSSLDDIRELKALEPLGVEGVIVVTAIYSGKVNLSEAIAICSSSD